MKSRPHILCIACWLVLLPALVAWSETGERKDAVQSTEVDPEGRQSLADTPARAAGQEAESEEPEVRKVAVLSFENHTSEKFDNFVRALSDMLMTSLGQAKQLVVIERIQIKKAMENFSLEMTGAIDVETAVEVGQWLGADAVVLGSFAQFGEKFRIDARMIEAQTGAVLIAQHVDGTESDVITLVDKLGVKLVNSLEKKETEEKAGSGFLQVRFMITRAEMTERPVYHQMCKLIVDSSELRTSRVIDQTEKWVTLFSEEIGAGKHRVQVVHGFVDKGRWDGELPDQPRIFLVVVDPGETTTIQYSYGVGWFSDAYYYKPPWKGGS